MLPIYQVFREVIEWTTQAQKTLEEICTALNIELRVRTKYICNFFF